ncbi:MAG: diphthine--ammonia ligase [Desulfurococcales archaeon]|nr:diphthine--ammonia ligase [Desulfurococcales archaeon]
MRVCSLLSGGKDSNYALYRAVRDGHEVACIASVRPARSDSWMFHVPAVDLVALQARAMGLEDRHERIAVSGVKEREVEELARALEPLKRRYGFDALVVGGIASRYQERRFRLIAERLGVRLYSPQWGVDPEEYMRRLVAEGFRFTLVRIATMGLPCRLLGRILEGPLLEELLSLARRHGFHPALEGGEGETLVLWQPLYERGSLWLRGRPLRLSEFECELQVLEAGLTGEKGDGRVELVEPQGRGYSA